MSTEGSDYDTVIVLWRNISSELDDVTCGDGQASLTTSVESGTSYLIEIIQSEGSEGGQIEFQAFSPEHLNVGKTTRVSVDSDGYEVYEDSLNPSISSDGRYIAFVSEAENLVSGDTNGFIDVFVHDQNTGETTRISIGDTGQEAEGRSDHANISPDGRYVAFRSHANNLVSPDTGWEDVYLFDRQTNEISLVNMSTEGVQGNCWSGYPSLSLNGDFVAFYSCADNLVSESSEYDQIYLRDIANEETSLVSIGFEGDSGNGNSYNPSISEDGRYIAFHSYASNLVENDTNGVGDVFVYDSLEEIVTRVSLSDEGLEGNGISSYAAISGDGRSVVFTSYSDNLVEDDTNGVIDIFVYDLETETIACVSLSGNGDEGDNYSSSPDISSDGRYITFASDASNLVVGDLNDATDIFLHDTTTGETILLSVDNDGNEGSGGNSLSPKISADGRQITFFSYADNLVVDDGNEVADVFVRDRNPVTDGNDEFENATPITETPFTDIVDTTTATKAGDDPVMSCTGSTGFNSVWYAYTPEEDGILNLNTENSDYATAVAIWTGSEPAEFEEIACDSEESLFTTPLPSGKTYWIEIVQNGEEGGGELEFQVEFSSSSVLIIEDGETVTVDDDRYDMIGFVESGDITIPFDNTSASIGIGDEILIITMLGDYEDIGTYETAIVESVGADTLTLTAPITNYYEGDDDYYKVMVQRVPSYSEVIIYDGGTLTAHAWDGETGGVVFFRADDVAVGSGGKIDVSELGYWAEEGAPWSDAHGDFYAPMFMGRGGEEPYTPEGEKYARGGGVIYLDVANILTVDGSISSQGQIGATITGDEEGYGGGDGGSIWIKSHTISGEGIISSLGGTAGSGEEYSGGGGHGGRIAIENETNDFNGDVQAYGGSDEYGTRGTPGTIYWVDEDRLIIDNNGEGRGGTVRIIEGEYAISSIELYDEANLYISGTGSSLILESDTVSSESIYSTIFCEGTITGPANFQIENYSIDAGGELVGVENLIVQDGNLTLYAHTPLRTGRMNFTSVAVEGTGLLTLVPYDNGDEIYTNDAPFELEAENITVGAGARISSDYQGYGYYSAYGPGAGSNSYSYGHGGYAGGSEDVENPGMPYGDFRAPTSLGSGSGGGAIHLIVDTLSLDGVLSAKGSAGSGGSVWIEGVTISGGGNISASSGWGWSSGGRIAIAVQDKSNYTGTTEAFGGYRSGGEFGGPGTIYWVNEKHLIIDNLGRDGEAAALVNEENYALNTIELTRYGHLDVLGEGSNFLLSNDTINGDGTATLAVSGILEAPEAFVIEGYDLDLKGDISGEQSDITLENGSELILYANTPIHSGAYTFGDILVNNDTTLRLNAYDNGDEDYTNDTPFRLNVETLTVEESGHVSADGLGYATTNRGIGAGFDEGGAGYGGEGGDSENGTGGTTYGSLEEPIALGSSGENGNGGGAVVINAANATMEGILSANGMDGCGSGSGGSIWLNSDSLYGSGTIQANGGNGNSCGGGGGGRIAIYADDTYAFSGEFTVNGGAGYEDGQEGTLFLNIVDPTNSTLSISPSTVPTDGSSEATITVTLLNAVGFPVIGKPVEIALASGGDIIYDGQNRTVNEFMLIGNSDASGEVTVNISAETLGERSIKARSEDIQLEQQGIVEFIPGPVNESTSSIESDKSEDAANGSSPVNITITLRDIYGNPISGATVTLSATGSAVVTQPTAVTNVDGIIEGSITDVISESVNVSASANGVTLSDTVSITFIGADLVVTKIDNALEDTGAIPVTNSNGVEIDGLIIGNWYAVETSNGPWIPGGGYQPNYGAKISNDGGVGWYSSSEAPWIESVQSINANYQRFIFQATTTSIHIRVSDSYFGDNSGSLSWSVFSNSIGSSDAGFGLPIYYSLSVRNDGLVAAENVVLTDILPNEISYISDNADVDISQDGQELTWALGAIAPAEKVDILLITEITAPPQAGLSVVNTLSVISDQLDENPDDNTVITTTPLLGVDMLVTMDAPAEIGFGEQLTYTLVVGNNGPAIAPDVILVDILPDEVSYISDDATVDVSQNGQELTWALGNIAVGEEITVTLVTEVIAAPAEGLLVENSVAVTSNGLEENSENNADSTETMLVLPDLVIAKTGPANVGFGLPIEYTLTLQNNGAVTARNVVLTDTLPDELIYVSDDAVADVNESGQELTWGLGDIASGEEIVIVLTTSSIAGGITPDQIVINTATLSADEMDKNPDDNTSSATTTLIAPDLGVALSATALSNQGQSSIHAIAGGDIAYTLIVENTAEGIAENVTVTDTLPAGLSFASESTGYTYELDSNTITWQVGEIEANVSVIIEFIASIDSTALGEITNTAVTATNSPEENLSNNIATLNTLIEVAVPILEVSPLYPTVTATQGESMDLSLIIRNGGAGAMTGITVTPPPNTLWVTVDTAELTDLAPGASTNITLTAVVDSSQAPGRYRDFVTVSENSGSQRFVALTVHVTAPTQVLLGSVENDQGQPVANATLTLTKQEPSVLVTEGVTEYYYFNTRTKSDASGFLNALVLETGTYDYTLIAEDHESTSGTLTISEGVDPQNKTFMMPAQPKLSLTPNTLQVGAAQGGTESYDLTIVNNGAAPMSGLGLTLPAAIPWVVSGVSDPLPSIDPGDSLSITFIIAPPADQPTGTYQDYLTVTANGDLSQQAALSIEVVDSTARDLAFTVKDEAGLPITTAGEIILVQQDFATLQLPGGEEVPYQPQFKEALDGSGVALFSALSPGEYNYLIQSDGYSTETGTVQVVAGTGSQMQASSLQPDPFTYSWNVERIEQEYDITLTLDYDYVTAPPTLMVLPQNWNACSSSQITRTIQIYNPTGITLDLDEMVTVMPGMSIQTGSLPESIGPGEIIDIPVTATVVDEDDIGIGAASVNFTYQSAPDHVVTYTLNPSSTSQNLDNGEIYSQEFGIDLVVSEAGASYTIDLAGGDKPAWITSLALGSSTLDAGGNTLSLAMDPSSLYAGEYTYDAELEVHGSDTSERYGTLHVEATKDENGVTLAHTTFELGDLITEEKSGTSSGGRIRVDGCDHPIWTWNFDGASGGGAGSAVGHSSSEQGVSVPSHTSPPTYSNGHQQVRLEILQKAMLEGESFVANLELANTGASSLDALSIDLLIKDTNGTDRSADFNLVPQVPTDLGSVGVGQNASEEWVIIPSKSLGISTPTGETFTIQAVIHYGYEGSDYSLETVPEIITVYPSPDLVINYELPYPDVPCTVFDLKVVIDNQGLGTARNFHLSTAMPVFVDATNDAPVGFSITSTTVNGVSVGRELNLSLGTIEPGKQIEVVWRLETSQPGKFVEFTSDYRQSNYEGVLLPPLISEINTTIVPGVCLPSTANICVDGDCVINAGSGSSELFDASVFTQTGQTVLQEQDISIPTSASTLTFERVYAQTIKDDASTSLGHGWTHSLDSRLILPDDPDGEAGYLFFKANTANRYRFIDNGDGTYSAAPGVIGTLVETNNGYRLLLSTQDKYIFDAEGKVTSWEDAEGNVKSYSYDANAQLIKVSADNGARFVALSYDANNRIDVVTDHANREVNYGYDANGDLVSVTDLAGEVWQYVYDSEHRLTEEIDPLGNTVKRTEYDVQGRAVRLYDGEDNLIGELTYNTDGTTTITDAAGNSETQIYDSRRTIVGRTNPLGASTEKTYDDNFRPATITDENGNTTSLTWSADGANLTNIVDARGNATSITYDALNNPTSVSDPLGHQTSYVYDGTLLSSSADALGNTTSYAYTADGKLETVTDALGHTTTYTYDEFGQMLSVTDAAGNTVNNNSYDDLGRLVDSIDAQGCVTHNEYDAAGRLLRVTQNYVPAREQNEDNLYNIVTEYQYDSVGNQIAVTDTYGSTTQYEYDKTGRMVKSIDPAGNENTSTYNELGQLVASTDALGHSATYEYDAAGRLISTTDVLGNTTTTSYNLDSTVASTTDALGHSTSYTYDELKRVVATTDHLGNSTTSAYDAAGNLVASTDKLGNTTSYEYDASGRLIRQTDPNGGVTETFYDATGNRVQIIDARDNATTYAYDELGRMISVADAQGNVTTTTYNEYGQRTAMTDAKGNTTTFAYDLLGRQISVTDPLGNTSTTAYDALGRVLSTTDALGNVNTSDYDSLGRLANQTNPAGGVTSFTYNAVGNQLTVTDPNGYVRSTAYDALNRAIASTDPKGNTVSTTYNAIGQIVTSTDALGNTSTFAYDELGRQTRLEDALGNISRYDYDANSNRISLTDANGIVTKFEYDALGRLTAVVENYRPAVTPTAEINVRTEYSYDANGNRLMITDGNSHVTNFSYDSLNRLATETDSLGNIWQHSYDANGNRLSTVDANGETTSYDYDENNRLLAIDYPGDNMDVAFNYDEIGRRTQMDDGLGTTAWDYDSLNRPTAITDPFGDTVDYSYDAVGNRTGLTYPDGKQVQYTYDPANLLAQVTDWNSQSTSYTYDANGRVTETSLPNGVTSSYVYNSVGQLTNLQHQTDTTTLSSFQYAYDNVGNRTQATEFFSGIGEADGDPTVLVTAMSSGGVPLAGKSVYVFDGTTYTGYNKITDGNGQASITLPDGNYRFRLDVDGTQFWSDAENHCQIAGCTDVMLTIPEPVLVSVQDSEGAVMEGLSVYAFDGTNYTGYHGVTDENGQLSMRLPEGDYRFRADFNGTQFWSDAENHCTTPACTIASIQITLPVTVSVADHLAMPQAGVNVYAFTGTTYSGYHALTDENGQVSLTLPEGEYRFRADFNGTQFWSSAENDCSVPGCNTAAVTVSQPLTVSVQNTNGAPQAGLKVYAFNGSTYAGYNQTSDANGEVQFTLPAGEYRFRADFNGTQFWSGAGNSCAVPGCGSASVTVSIPLTVAVQDTDGVAASGLKVYAFDGTNYQSYNKTSDANGEAIFTLPLGSYRFRADLNGTQFWSDSANHCTLPGCTSAAVTVSKPVRVLIQNGAGQAEAGVKVYAFDGTSYQSYSKTSDVNGETIFTLPLGSYRFRADFAGAQYWSGSENSCDIPDCESDLVIVEPIPNTPTPSPTAPATATSTPVVPQTPAATATSTETPIPSATATSTPEGSASLGAGKVLMIGLPIHIQSQPQAENSNVLVTVSDTNNSPASGLKVYAFNGTTYAGINGTTDANGQVSLALPAGEYRFRADLNGTQFWSAEENHCTTPDCSEAALTVTVPLTVTISDTSGTAAAGLKVYAFDGTTYAGYTQTTDANGQVVFTLPEGGYRFRADLNGTQFWSDGVNHCTLPGCASAAVTVTLPLTVTISDTSGTVAAGLNVYAFDGTTYAGYTQTTDANGQVVFTLPEGEYRFRADLNGTQFWSAESNFCSLPGCTNASVEVTQPITVTVAGQAGTPYPDLNVYAFSAGTYTGYHGVTDENGQIDLTLPTGEYRFRADYDGVQFWSSSTNDCSIPECLEASVLLPETSGGGEISTTIDYTYDDLYRLTYADYTSSSTELDGSYYAYTYDAVGNRLTQETLSGTNTYTYDIANRMTGVDGIAYSYDNNGNLLTDGVNTYTYDYANRLIAVNGQTTTTYAYNGLGDRHQQNGVNYTLDLNTGLTQVLADDTNTYLYGNGRIAQQTLTTEYFLPDALGSVRQLADPLGAVTLTQSYAPYGETVSSLGGGYSRFQFTGEAVDANGLTYLRARYYDPQNGRFTQRDPSGLEANLFLYGAANPITRTDPSGLFSREQIVNTFYRGGLFHEFLDAIPHRDEAGNLVEHWGFFAALLDAEPGDRLDIFAVDLMGRLKDQAPLFKKVDGYYLGQREFYGKSVIVRDGNPNYPYTMPSSGGWLARYYTLTSNQGRQYYIDGGRTTDYPDFVFSNYGIGDGLKKIIEVIAKRSVFEGASGTLCSFTAGKIVDRYGNVYTYVSPGAGLGVTIASSGMGWVTPYGSPNTLYSDAETLKDKIEGISVGVGFSAIVGFNTYWGTSARTSTRSAGLLMGIGGEASFVFWDQDASSPSRGWQNAIDAEMGKSPFTIFRSDLENRE